jgi:hypothetical protein
MKIEKNINFTGRLLRLLVGMALLLYALWNMSGIALLLSLFVFFEYVMSWCVIYQILGKKSCDIRK